MNKRLNYIIKNAIVFSFVLLISTFAITGYADTLEFKSFSTAATKEALKQNGVDIRPTSDGYRVSFYYTGENLAMVRSDDTDNGLFLLAGSGIYAINYECDSIDGAVKSKGKGNSNIYGIRFKGCDGIQEFQGTSVHDQETGAPVDFPYTKDTNEPTSVDVILSVSNGLPVMIAVAIGEVGIESLAGVATTLSETPPNFQWDSGSCGQLFKPVPVHSHK